VKNLLDTRKFHNCEFRFIVSVEIKSWWRNHSSLYE